MIWSDTLSPSVITIAERKEGRLGIKRGWLSMEAFPLAIHARKSERHLKWYRIFSYGLVNTATRVKRWYGNIVKTQRAWRFPGIWDQGEIYSVDALETNSTSLSSIPFRKSERHLKWYRIFSYGLVNTATRVKRWYGNIVKTFSLLQHISVLTPTLFRLRSLPLLKGKKDD
jgi:hypothetical protein